LNLIFSADSFPNYDLALETAEGARVWSQAGVKSHGISGGSKQIFAVIPSRTLKNGYYVLRIAARNGQGVEEVEEEDVAAYSFQVTRR